MVQEDEKEKLEAAPESDSEKRIEKETEEKGRVDYNQLDSGESANGILEVMSDGYGFIRCENYLPGRT